jgi:hypothetical protein
VSQMHFAPLDAKWAEQTQCTGGSLEVLVGGKGSSSRVEFASSSSPLPRYVCLG